MGSNSSIEWTDHTFNPVRGCAAISPGCDHCYAEAMSKRNPATLGTWGPQGRRVFAAESYWKQPLKWDAEAKAAGRPARVFCASLADLFEGPHRVDDSGPYDVWHEGRNGPRADYEEMLVRLWNLAVTTPNLRWLLLTKRPWNLAAWWKAQEAEARRVGAEAWFPSNIWVGTTVEDQARADERIPHLLEVPARVRFLSVEPMVGPVDLAPWLADESDDVADGPFHTASLEGPDAFSMARGIQWVIVGGESGPHARPMHPAWARAVRDQCGAAGVPFHFKQWGEWLPICDMPEEQSRALYVSRRKAEEWESQEVVDEMTGMRCTVPELILRADGNHRDLRDPEAFCGDRPGWPAMHAFRVGKKAAGRLLEGRTWDELPAEAR